MNAPERYLDRLGRAAAEAGAQGFDAMVVTPSPDLAYLTGYAPPPLERLTLLVMRPELDPILLVPALERPLAATCPVGDRVELVAWTDGSDPSAVAASLLPERGRVAACDRMWGAHLLALQAANAELAYAPASGVISKLRAVKDSDELAALTRAGRGADETFRQICATRFEGRREEEVAADLADLLVRNGHTRADFTIVASGPNGASPHHDPGARTIRGRDAVVLDFGGELAGYFSDTTRTVVVGEPPPGFEEVYGIVREAQEAACRVVAPGIAADEVDRAARRLIEDAGYGDAFVHRTGHGIGLEVHEPPYIVEGNALLLESGMTFSVEPGVYLEGRFGVRIEDIVAVTSDGVVRLNRSSRDLTIVA